MAIITAVPLDEALSRPRKGPSAHTLRTRRLEADADEVARAVNREGAALITVSDEDLPTRHYLSGLRSALHRRGYTDILLQKRRGQDQIAAWEKRPEDQARLEKRRQTGARLGQIAKERRGNGQGSWRGRAG